MSNSIIKVKYLSKRYRLGLREKQSKTLSGQIANLIKTPWQNLKRLREMNHFGIEDESVFWALKDINFEVKEGEILGVIGKNGAGKSTLLKILSGITDPTSGKIEIYGRVASLLEVGTGFHPELSGRENIYMNGTILGMSRNEIHSKLDEIIDFSGVEKFIDTPVKFYSSGMKVRLGFSVAAHLEPEILIIDEVLAVGDYEFQKKCLGKMEDVTRNQGRTVLFVSHHLGSIKSLCSYCLYLENGIIRTNGYVEFVIDEYLNSNSISEIYLSNDSGQKPYYINSIYLFDSSATQKYIFKDSEEIFINYKVEVKENPIELYLLSTILDSEKGKIFSSEIKVIEAGVYILKINKHFLVRGRYFVQSILYRPGIAQFDFIESSNMFQVQDDGSAFKHLETFDYGKVIGNCQWV